MYLFKTINNYMWNVISLFFFFSGVTGLIYEVLWAKYLSLLLGSTAQANAIVLATFMGGLALGNFLLGIQADRAKNHLRLYGWLELGIDLLGAIPPKRELSLPDRVLEQKKSTPVQG